MLWNCFVGFFFSLVLCNLPFPGEGGLQCLGCRESQDNRSIRRCSAGIPQLLSDMSAMEAVLRPADPGSALLCCQPSMEMQQPGHPLAWSSFVHSCWAGPRSPVRSWGCDKDNVETPGQSSWASRATARCSLAWWIAFPARYPTGWCDPFPPGVWSQRPCVHPTVFNWWKLSDGNLLNLWWESPLCPCTQCCMGCCWFLSQWHNPASVMYYVLIIISINISVLIITINYIFHIPIFPWPGCHCQACVDSALLNFELCSLSGSEVTQCSNLGWALCAGCSAAARPGLAHAAAQLLHLRCCAWEFI